MPSLDRAHGLHGLAVALAAAATAGAVHGVIAGRFGHLAVQLATGLALAPAPLMGGIVSARRTQAGSLATGLAMVAAFVLARWAGWALMVDGPGGGSLIEAAAMLGPALFGCHAGHEPAAA